MCGEELPANVRLTLAPALDSESSGAQPASLFGECDLPPHKKKIFALLKAAEAVHIDEIVESLELVFRPLICSWLLSSLS